MIETGHEVSDNIGLKHFTAMLATRFPDLTIHFYANQSPFQWV